MGKKEAGEVSLIAAITAGSCIGMKVPCGESLELGESFGEEEGEEEEVLISSDSSSSLLCLFVIFFLPAGSKSSAS